MHAGLGAQVDLAQGSAEGAGRGQHLLEPVAVAEVDPLWVKVIVPARYLSDFREEMTARVTPEGEGREPIDAKVTVVDRVVDAASGTFAVRLEVPNPGLKIPAGLRCALRLDEGSFRDQH